MLYKSLGSSFLLVSISSLFLSMKYFFLNETKILEWSWGNFSSKDLSIIGLLDFESLLFLSVVFCISSMVVFYSINYMSEEVYKIRFVYLVFLFVFSMALLILSPNLMSILFGWDGLGLVSFCLVIFYQNAKSYNAGMLTVLSNRVGDAFLLISIGLFMSMGSWNVNFLNIEKFYFYDVSLMFIIFTAITKSAQIPFSSWLPAAMAAPTPVSALVHSSTLVTAGVYLLIRILPSYQIGNFWFTVLMVLSSSTMVMSGLAANFEMDFKKIIALSTLSQLGVMMTSISLGLFGLAYFHLIMHALFKSLLFMCAGNLIHMSGNNQDLRKYGDFILKVPVTSVFFLTSNLALCGMPFLAGFYSKDLILEIIMNSQLNLFSFFLMFLGTFLTVSYTTRLLILCLSTKFKVLKATNQFVEEENWMIPSMSVMFFLSVVFGKLGSSLFFVSPLNCILLSPLMKSLTLSLCILSSLLGILLFCKSISYTSLNKMTFKSFFMDMWFLTSVSLWFLKSTTFSLSLKANKVTTHGWIEYLMGNLLLKEIFISSYYFTKMFSSSLFMLILVSIYLVTQGVFCWISMF